ncbi:MAG: AzlD domain-containing protein [Atopobiaceae bacterium]|nr:AzlD domain-containing protein [Atopobiaceae bacterium]
MSTTEFLILYGCVLATMLLSRCVPLFALKGRSLSPRVTEALGLIPPAAFAALVANDLFQPDVLAKSPIEGILPFVAAIPVLVVAKRTHSLIWSALVGMVAYALLLSAANAL